MKTKTQLYNELNLIFSSRENLLKYINYESFYAPKELIDEINNDTKSSKELKSILKYHLYIEQFTNRVLGYIREIKIIIFDKIDNPYDVKKKCDFLYKENQKLHNLIKRINPKFKVTKIEFTNEVLDALSLILNVQSKPLNKENAHLKFKIINDYLEKQETDESKINDYIKKIFQKNTYEIYKEIALINSEICEKNASDLSLFYTLNKVDDFLVLSPISTKTISNNTKKPKPELLIDIWEVDKDGYKEYYNEVIQMLQKNFLNIDNAFVSNINNNLYWNMIAKKGSKSYLAGFIHTCIKRKWIIDKYSAKVITEILKKTFNLETLDPKTFRNISIFDKQLYIKPFDFLKENK